MKTEPDRGSSVEATSTALDNSQKLLSLLGLAAGAVAIPQTGQADIIFTDLSSAPAYVGFNVGGPSFTLDQNMPGVTRLGFQRNIVNTSFSLTTFARRYVSFLKVAGSGTVGIANAIANAGARWGQLTVSGFSGLDFRASINGFSPASFNNKYLAFRFRDQMADPWLYGWVQVSLANSTSELSPEVKISGYAYDNTGAQIAMGATPPVPEPSAAALLVCGALTLGAAGLRQWRRNRNG